ncbi:hypothetical protein [Peribacillus glennii]|uniref:hypothetical protein n=1 Tax=Peribacillus glennii TaxID=2303991 RepID=UPI001314D465|nr:hypothetical protein [Peribacillus glennii]
MSKDNQSHMIHSQYVDKKIDQLESQQKNQKNKTSTTNEIQPMATEDGLTQ